MTSISAYILKGIIIYFFTYLITRTLSKKAINEMASYEIAGIMILSNVAAEPIVTKSTTTAILGLILIGGLIVASSKISLINKLTTIMEHTPSVVISKGQLDMKALKSNELSLNQLLGLLREKGYDSLEDIDYAILEPQGNISVFPIPEKKSVTIKDLKLPTEESGITVPLIVDGSIIDINLKHTNYTKERLIKELKVKGIKDYSNLALVELNSSKNLIIYKS